MPPRLRSIRDPEHRLERLDLRRERGLRHVALLGRAAEVAVTRDGQEIAKLAQSDHK